MDVLDMDVPAVWTLSDEALLAGLGSGDPGASAEFVRRYQHRVVGLTLSILRDRGAAEEAAQETFVRAWRHAAAYDARRGAVAGWLLTIARNVSINMLPSRRIDPVDPALMPEAGDSAAIEGSEEHVTNSLLVREALARIPHDQRRALLLASFFGYTAQEMSELDGIPLGTAKTRIRAAMMKLRAELGVSHER